MADSIHIADLGRPQLTAAQRQAIAFGETLSVSFDRDGILREAEAHTGLRDWGPPDFIERLDLLCEEWGGDRNRLGLSRHNLRQKLLSFAKNRLLVQDRFNRHPEIDDIPIERPVIVVGLPRSGTTHLVNLMAADTRLRALPLWESYEPVPPPGEDPPPGRVPPQPGTEPPPDPSADPRHQRCAAAWEAMRQFVPLLAAMHPMDPDHIHEEIELMAPNFGSYNMEWLASRAPRWRDHYYQEDQTYQYEYMRRMLKLLLWQQGPGRPTRWLLKCPQHLEQLPVLLKVFPDATIAITHRDPVAVIQSAVTMLAYGNRMSHRRIDTGALLAYWADRVEHLLRGCVNDRAKLPPGQSIDVPFEGLIADDIRWVERIYHKAGIRLTNQARRQMQAFTARHKDSYGRVAYNLREQFGVEPAALRERFAFYCDVFLNGSKP